MIYRFVKEGENIQRIGNIDAESLEITLKTHLDAGESLATAEEYDQQTIGAVNKQLEAALAKIAELEKQLAEKTAE